MTWSLLWLNWTPVCLSRWYRHVLTLFNVSNSWWKARFRWLLMYFPNTPTSISIWIMSIYYKFSSEGIIEHRIIIARRSMIMIWGGMEQENGRYCASDWSERAALRVYDCVLLQYSEFGLISVIGWSESRCVSHWIEQMNQRKWKFLFSFFYWSMDNILRNTI